MSQSGQLSEEYVLWNAALVEHCFLTNDPSAYLSITPRILHAAITQKTNDDMTTTRKTHVIRLDGSIVCGARPQYNWETDCIAPTCGRCRAHYARIKAD